jgi:hypothetical protein
MRTTQPAGKSLILEQFFWRLLYLYKFPLQGIVARGPLPRQTPLLRLFGAASRRIDVLTGSHGPAASTAPRRGDGPVHQAMLFCCHNGNPTRMVSLAWHAASCEGPASPTPLAPPAPLPRLLEGCGAAVGRYRGYAFPKRAAVLCWARCRHRCGRGAHKRCTAD